MSHLRFHEPHAHLASAFGDGGFGKRAEAFARFFGTPKFIMIQTGIVIAWIALNATGVFNYDLYPFILLNLGFSLQAAYAAPLILLAQTRQADRDKLNVEADAKHREELSTLQIALLKDNTKLTEQVAALSERIEGLTKDLHGKLMAV